MKTPVQMTVNAHREVIEVEPGTTLLTVLRDLLGLTGTKEGCLEGECGACTVLIDGQPVDSCLVMAHAVEDSVVTTIEGVTGPDGELAPLQRAIVEHGGVQCGFCTPGVVMTLTALLNHVPTPTEPEIRHALAGNICRCTGYTQIVDAVVSVSAREAQ